MTKIYAQGNYIVIEANNERKTFQKKGVGFEILNDDGLYNLNYKGLPIGDFNYSEVKKEDDSDYATPLEFETFLFENTGNFNSGADGSPNYIPLTGTEVGKPITGDLVIEDTKRILGLLDLYIEANGELHLISGNNVKVSTVNGSGIVSDFDYSNISPEDKLVYAQRQYVERPETLINCLNNATPEQLSTIKSILGIV